MVEQLGYSGKLINRLRSTFDASQLVSVGGPFDGSKIKSRQLMDYMPPSPVNGAAIVEVAEFNTALPRAVADLLFTDGLLAREGYMMGLGGIDYQSLPKLAVDMTHRKMADSTVIRVVHGATIDMPLRGLSSLLPALVLMEQLQKSRIQPPQLQMISAHNISGELKRVDIPIARAQAEKFAFVAHSFIETFFPSLVDLVTFLQDTPLSKGSAIRDEIIKVAGVIRNGISEDSDNDLRAKGSNNGAQRMYRLYGAAHLLIHDTTFPESLKPIIPDVPLPNNPTTIISIGGKQEILFYKVRQQTKPFLGSEYQRTRTLQYFTRHHVPPYSMAQGGDISLDQALHADTTTEIATTARYDLDYLERVSYRRGDFEKFIGRQRRLAA